LKNTIKLEDPWMSAADTSHRFLDKPDPKEIPVRRSEHLVATTGCIKFTKKYPRLALFAEFMGK